MAFNESAYRENTRVITYVGKETKAKLKKAKEDLGLKSVSKLAAEIIDKNCDAHIEKLKEKA